MAYLVDFVWQSEEDKDPGSHSLVNFVWRILFLHIMSHISHGEAAVRGKRFTASLWMITASNHECNSDGYIHACEYYIKLGLKITSPFLFKTNKPGHNISFPYVQQTTSVKRAARPDSLLVTVLLWQSELISRDTIQSACIEI